MINHARTLLLNTARSRMDQTALADEYIDPMYQPVALPLPLQAVWEALFGSNPDSTGLNYRWCQFQSILHTPPLEPYTLFFDSRVLYFPSSPDFFQNPPGLRITTPEGVAVTGLCPASLLTTQDNRLQLTWLGQIVTEVTPDLLDTQVEVIVNVPEPVLLSRVNGASVQWQAGAADTPFHVVLLRRPAVGLADLPLAVGRVLHAEASNALFGVVPQTPYDTFYNWWKNSDQIQYRLGGLLLAFIYRLQEMRS